MQRILIVMGIVFLSILIIIILMVFFVLTGGRRLDMQSKKYMDSANISIISAWNMQELIKRASPELKAATSDADLEKIFNLFRKLGGLKKYNGCEGGTNVSLSTQHGKIITAEYVAKAEFDNGSATITVKLIKHANNWQILGFNIDSKAFLE